MRGARHRVASVAMAASVLAACGGGDDGSAAAPDGDRGDRLVRALAREGYYEATGDADRRAVVETYDGLCGRLDEAPDEAARYADLVAFLRASGSITATGGWPRARVATVAVPILCPRHADVTQRAVGTVS